MRRICILLLFVSVQFNAVICAAFFQEEDGPLLKKAAKEYNALRFTSAIRELSKVIEKDPGNVRAQEMLASSYRNIKEYDGALLWYSELSKQKDLKPEWALYYAEALANKEKYEESEKWYRKYLAFKPNDRRAAAFSRSNIGSLSKNEGEWDIEFLNINTDASDYSPMYYKDGLLFISNRQQKTRFMFAWDQTPYTDMYVIDDLSDIIESDEAAVERRLSGNNDNKPNSIISLIFSGNKSNASSPGKGVRLLRSKVKTSYHEGPATRLPEGSLMFTRNNYYNRKAGTSNTGINKLKMYTATGGNWDRITEFPYNNDEYSTGHPTISPDGRVLVFTSDMPRGYGGTDLYYSVRTSDKGNWGRPVNLGPKINTEGNEQFPYLDKNGKLYFASTGYPGLGGLDIFEVDLKDMKAISRPRNLGAGINSSADDFGLVKASEGETGFFSSNRRGNDDIYRFRKLNYSIKLKGLVLDSKTNVPISGSKVLFKRNGITDTLQTDQNGAFNKILTKASDYEISGRALSYVSKEEFISTTGISTDSTINLVLELDQAADRQQWVINNCDSLKKSFALENIYYDLDIADVREDFFPVLDRMADLMRKNPEINIITASHCDSRASQSYNKDLSLRRGRAARAYLMEQGIDGDRIEVKYYGKSRLVNTCFAETECSEADQQMNRRTEFEVIINGVNLSQVNCGN